MSPARRNALASYLNFAVLAAVGLVANPLLAGALGPVAFGIWKAVQRIFDVGAAADGQATQALKWVIAHRGREADPAGLRRMVGSALRVWLLWLPALLLIQLGLVLMLPVLIADVPEHLGLALMLMGAVFGLDVVARGVAGIPDAALVGSNLGYRSMLVTTLLLPLSNVALVIVALSDAGELVGLAGVVLAATVLNGGLTWLVAGASLPWFGASRPEPGETGELARFGGWVLGWALVARLMLATEVLLLGAILGATAVTAWVFTSFVLQFALAACLMTASAMMPGLGRLLGQGEIAQAAARGKETREIVAAIATVLACLMILFNEAFVGLWAGPEVFMGQTLTIGMSFAFVQLALCRCDGQIQDAGLKLRPKVLLGAASMLLSLLFGGVALALTGAPWVMIGAIMVARLPMWLGFAVMVRRLLGPSSALPRRSLPIAAGALAFSVLLAPLVPQSAWVVTALPPALCLTAVAGWLMLTPLTRAKLMPLRR